MHWNQVASTLASRCGCLLRTKVSFTRTREIGKSSKDAWEFEAVIFLAGFGDRGVGASIADIGYLGVMLKKHALKQAGVLPLSLEYLIVH